MSNNGWSIAENVIKHIEQFLPKGSNILEFGSGRGTKTLLCLGYNVYSIEEDIRFYQLFHENYCLAPVREDGWYDRYKVKSFIKDKEFDCLLIDGPAHGERAKILDPDSGVDFDKFKIIIVDDLDRDEDDQLFEKLSANKQNIKEETHGVIFND